MLVRPAALLVVLILGAAGCASPGAGTAGEPARGADVRATSALRGRTIVVDPGHGGTAAADSYRVGRTGEREEWIDLRVALLLRDMLEERGARVVLTREQDVAVGLADRAALARTANADAFVSIHHNATADPDANFPVVYYHGYASRNPAGVKLARLLAARLDEKLFGGRARPAVVSDHVIFPASGTAVLRHSWGIPGVIGEASFFTNPAEEQRLRSAAHNRREAEAYVLALRDFFSETVDPVLPQEPADPLEPFEAAQEAERMGAAALRWHDDYLDAVRLMREPEGDLERAFELLTRSVRSFPDSNIARDAHLLRAEILEAWGRGEEAAETRRRVEEFYAGD